MMNLNRDSRGFIAILFITLLPLLLTVLIAWIAAESAMVHYARVQHICRKAALHIQEITLTSTNDLIALNPQAKALRNEYDLAQHAYDIAIYPPARAAALAWKTSVRAREFVLAARQNALWMAGNARAVQEQTTYIMEFANAFAIVLHPKPFPLNLKRTPSSNITPDFNPSDGFEIRQPLQIEWKTDLSRAVSPLLLNWLTTTAKNNDKEGMQWVQGSCGSTYIKKSQSGMDRFTWRLDKVGKSWWNLF